VSIKQKQLQLPTKFSYVVVGLANPGWQTVPAAASAKQSGVTELASTAEFYTIQYYYTCKL